MTETRGPRRGTRFSIAAYLRDGDIIIEGEALTLALLLHSQGKDRNSSQGRTVQQMMRDINLEKRRSRRKGADK